MKKTAVQWFLDNMPDLGSYIPLGVSLELHAKYQQALEMEKQQRIQDMGKMQIINDVDPDGNVKFIFDPETYYKQTYE